MRGQRLNIYNLIWSVLLLLLTGAHLSAQQATLQWVQRGGGGGFIGSNSSHPDPDEVFGSAIDKDDNLIVGGACTWTPSFDSISFNYINGIQYSNDNGFVAKYNSCGEIQWVSVIWGRQGESVNGLDVDEEGNIYVLGYGFVGSTVNDSIVIVTPYGNTIFRNSHVFFAKYSPDGHLLYVKTYPYIQSSMGSERFFPYQGRFKRLHNNTFLAMVEANSSNDTVHIGNYITVPGSRNFIVLDSLGNTIKGAMIDTLVGYGIHLSNFALDANENIYFTLINLDRPSISILSNSFSPAYQYTAYLVKTDTSFTIKDLTNGYYNAALGSLKIKGDAIYAFGENSGNASFDGDTISQAANFYTYTVYRLDTNLNLQWVSKPDSSINANYSNIMVGASEDNVYLGFQLRGYMKWDSAIFSAATNNREVVLLRLRASDGVCVDGKLMNGNVSEFEQVTMIQTDRQGNAYYIGAFAGNIGVPTDSVYANGNVASPDYFIVKWGLPCTDTISTLDAPAVPINLVATATGTQTIDISWNDVAQGETGFNLYRSPDGINNWTMVATTAANTPLYTNSNLTPNTTYWYKVTSFNQTSESAYSNIDSATTWPAVCSTGIAYNNTDSLYTFNTSNTGTGPFVYNWSINGNVSAAQNLNAILDTAGTYHICVTVTDAFNCTSTACDTITIVAPVCGTNVSATQTGTYSYSFTTVNTGTAPYAYSWTMNGNNPSTSNPFTYTFPGTTSSYNVCVTVTDGNNCTATACDTVDIQQATCATSLTYTTLNSIYTFSTENTGTAPYTYSWTNGGTPFIADDTATLLLAAGTHNICVTVTDANNCTATGCQVITVQAATCTTSLSYTTVNNTYTFSTANTGTAPYTYSWTNSGTPFSTNDTASLQLSAGTHNICVTVSDANNCTANACETISIAAICEVNITNTNTGNNYSFTANTTGTAPYTYLWTNNGTALPSNVATATVQLSVGSNNVCVTVTDAVNCQASSCDQITIVGIAQTGNAAINIYPNPMNDIMYADIQATQDMAIQLTITDIQGRVMVNEIRELKTGSNLLAYSTERWMAGIYQLQAQYGNNSYTAKLVKID